MMDAPRAPEAEPAPATRGDESASRALRGALERNRRPSCRELARRADGTIDQAALEACLRRRRAEGARKATAFAPPKWVSRGLPPAATRRRATRDMMRGWMTTPG